MQLIQRLLVTLLCLFLGTLSFSVQASKFNGYQWPGDRGDWYEWWYYKVVLPETDQSFYFVYGIVNPWDSSSERTSSGSYVSMGSFGDQEIWGEKFPSSALKADPQKADVRIGDNFATENHLVGHLKNKKDEEVEWDLKVKKDWAFNAMGWSTGMRGISNIYWYPAQAGAKMTGVLRYKGKEIRIENAPAYQDRNWGRSLPKWWVWIVSNHFEGSPGTVLALGGGRPKVFERFSVKDGIAIGLTHKGKEYVFRNPDGDTIRSEISFGKWEVEAINTRNQRVVISAYAPREKFMRLEFISPRGEKFNDYEALKGDLTLEIFERKTRFHDWKSVEKLTSHEAGIEYGSFEQFDLEKLFSQEIQLK